MKLRNAGLATLILSAMVISLFMFAGSALSGTDPRDAMGITKFEKPEKAPEFKLKDINGKKVSLRDYRGKALFVTFWATW